MVLFRGVDLGPQMGEKATYRLGRGNGLLKHLPVGDVYDVFHRVLETKTIGSALRAQ